MTRHNFECRKCHIKFGFESDISDINRFKKKLKRGIRCPECDDKWGETGSNIIHDLPKATSARDVEKLRRSNAQASSEANAAAARHTSLIGAPEMVDIKRPKNAKGSPGVMPGAAVEKIPKSVVDSLQYKQGFEPK